MTFWKLIRRSLCFHARSHLGVVLGATIGSAVLIGALVVGDSVKESLQDSVWSRFGQVHFGMVSNDRLFKDDLGQVLHESFNGWNWWWNQTNNIRGSFMAEPATALVLPAVAARQDNESRANHIRLIGFAKHQGRQPPASGIMSAFATNVFWWLRPDGPIGNLGIGEVAINEVLAKQLGAEIGEQIVFRIRKPSALGDDSAIAPKNDMSISLTLRIKSIINAKQWGNFEVHSASSLPMNAFVDLDQLQQALNLPGRANTMLYGKGYFAGPSVLPMSYLNKRWVKPALNIAPRFVVRFFAKGVQVSGEDVARRLNFYLSNALRLEDVQARLNFQNLDNQIGLSSSRVFLDGPIVHSAFSAETNAQPILTYLATLLRSGKNTTPYSMVTAAGAPWTPAGMRDDEIILNQWLADDLQATLGDEISVAYFDPESGARLVERTNTFRVRGIVPLEMPWADRTLMPDFPGIEKAESTSDWDAGFPLVHKIRPKDEDYWKKYRGTPKAFVTLAAGKKMWANRFGELTAIRFPIPAGEKPDEFQSALEKKILASLKPEELGLRFEPVREQALKAAEQSQDFGQLFLGFSFFLIIAALVLMALLFQFGLEQRTTEIGTLLALGFTQKQVRSLLLREGIVLALIGGAGGAIGGIFYAKVMLHALTTVWRDAVGTSSLQFHASPKTLVIGFLASTVVATLTIWLTLRKQAKRPARELLAGEVQGSRLKVQGARQSVAQLVGAGAALSAVALVGWAISKGETSNAEIFFSAGALVLISGLAFSAAWLRKLGTNPASANLSLGSFGLRSSAGRSKRTLATISMLACGSFLIVAISAFRLDSNQNATNRSSGTGGFALIGETTMPIVHDLNGKSGLDFFALNENDLAGVSFVPFRVHEGDEASCLNLNRAQKPRLLGVKPEMLDGRFTFAKGAGWNPLINTGLQPGESASENSGNRLSGFPKSSESSTGLKSGVNEIEIPAIGDANSIQWALHKKIGDAIDYADERGNVFKLRLVGAVANSILQGSLIIDEAEFIKRFPSESGYKMFLIDSPTSRVAEVSAILSRAMEDVGLELAPAARRLNEFNAVQNTYLGTFQILGGLGLLLGSAGLGIVVLRNVLERRGELGLLVAVGFRKRALQWMLLSEHSALLGLGLGIGLIAAVVAILPSLISPSAEIPFVSVGITLGAVLLNGALWTWVATKFALRGNLLAALRNE